MNPKSMAAKGNMSRKKANMRKQEGMMKKSNMNDKPKMKSNAKRRKNSNKNANKRRQPTSKAPSGQKQGYASFAERLQALRAQVSIFGLTMNGIGTDMITTSQSSDSKVTPI